MDKKLDFTEFVIRGKIMKNARDVLKDITKECDRMIEEILASDMSPSALSKTLVIAKIKAYCLLYESKITQD